MVALPTKLGKTKFIKLRVAVTRVKELKIEKFGDNIDSPAYVITGAEKTYGLIDDCGTIVVRIPDHKMDALLKGVVL